MSRFDLIFSKFSNKWSDRSVHDGRRTDGRTHGHTDGRTDGQTDIPICGDRDVISASRKKTRGNRTTFQFPYCAKRLLRPGPRKWECPSVRPSVRVCVRVCKIFVIFAKGIWEPPRGASALWPKTVIKKEVFFCIFNLLYLLRYLELEAHVLWEKIWEHGVNAFETVFHSNSKFPTPLFRISDSGAQILDIDRFEFEKYSYYLHINILLQGFMRVMPPCVTLLPRIASDVSNYYSSGLDGFTNCSRGLSTQCTLSSGLQWVVAVRVSKSRTAMTSWSL